MLPLAKLVEVLAERIFPDRLGGQVKILDLLDLLLRVRRRRLGVSRPVDVMRAAVPAPLRARLRGRLPYRERLRCRLARAADRRDRGGVVVFSCSVQLPSS